MPGAPAAAWSPPTPPFSPAQRAAVRDRLLAAAADEPTVGAAVLLGSTATGTEDGWSDLDIAFGVIEPLPSALERWTRFVDREFEALHHWDLPSGAAVYRVFLLTPALELDLSVTPLDQLAPRGPAWRPVFGAAAVPVPLEPERVDRLAGHAWHHALHAASAIGRGHPLAASHWIASLREQVIALACRRAGLPTSYAKAAHLLPPGELAPLEASLVASLDEPELRRALDAATRALLAELARSDADLAARLAPALETCLGPSSRWRPGEAEQAAGGAEQAAGGAER